MIICYYVAAMAVVAVVATAVEEKVAAMVGAVMEESVAVAVAVAAIMEESVVATMAVAVATAVAVVVIVVYCSGYIILL